ncbi:uncharacterized protein DSM5745_11251 [Aspergillus mulundensis]|uniref:Uncharacterized protein n=1 Tax=Aspergillus mulundensis TaxID=1810919 RepID=A0A3D8QA61_9EURO|nr:hypothetical protein DSM5745_11251 [Aspergillus mulundensis]RDW58560.1 hypothetical protein DSM5745_11251 [Aspergillus mulundensis]
MSLTPLDTSLSRFLEFSITLVFPQVYGEDELHGAAQSLLEQWPILSSRLNLLRTDLRASKPGQQPHIFKGNHIDKKLSDVVDVSSINLEHASASPSDTVKRLDSLLNFGNGLNKALRGQVFIVRAVFFLEATVIRFTFQHPLCDASGAHEIAKAYCDILNGNTVEKISFTRFPLTLQDSNSEGAEEKENNAPVIPTVADTARPIFHWSWRYMLRKGTKLLLRDLRRPSCQRVDRTLYIPPVQMETWKEEARRANISVTEHDLLTAFIYQSCYQRSPTCTQDFSLILGIRRYLEHQTPLQNACFVLPVAIDYLYNSQKFDLPPLPELAAEIRRTILEARQPQTLSALLEFHSRSTKTPMIPRWIGRDQPQVAVTSWTDLGLYDLDIRGSKPVFVHGQLDLWGVLKKFGLGMDDIVITWKGPEHEGGYWIRGRLNASAWENMEETLGQK